MTTLSAVKRSKTLLLESRHGELNCKNRCASGVSNTKAASLTTGSQLDWGPVVFVIRCLPSSSGNSLNLEVTCFK